jgi:uncharacterized protein (DUF342 family)
MSAMLIIELSTELSDATVVDAHAALAAAGVTAGIDEEAVARALNEVVIGRPCIVACGRPAIDGTAATVEYAFAVDGQLQPTLRADGRADFHDLNAVQNVRAGQILATKTPATAGQDGFNVRGQRLPARAGRDHTLSFGRGCELSADGLSIIASADGHVSLGSGRRISVLQVYEVRGNVDLSTGNIRFVGNVIIHGNVTNGLMVEAEGDVTVEGYVDAGFVRAQGNVVIRRGIQGRGKGQVEAGGTLAAAFAENATLSAGGDVIVHEAIMHSNVNSGGSIACIDGRGLIVGGRLRAAGEIHAKVIGASMGTQTELEVGVDPRLREEMIAVIGELRQSEDALRQTEQAFVYLSDLGRMTRDLPPEQREKIKALAATRTHLLGRVGELRERRAELEAEAESRLHSCVRASDRINPGTRVTIGRATLLLQDQIKHSSLILADDRTVRASAYD